MDAPPDLLEIGDLIDSLLDPPTGSGGGAVLNAADFASCPGWASLADKECSPQKETQCWGAFLKKDDGAGCTPGFTSGKAHFKNKFCSACCTCIDIPASRVRAMRPEMQPLFANSLRAGFWKTAPDSLGGGEVRIANNTITCDGPWLIVYKELPPELPWETMPEGWVQHGGPQGGMVQFAVAKGTLVPSSEIWRQPTRGGTSMAMGHTGHDAAHKRRRRAPVSMMASLAAPLVSKPVVAAKPMPVPATSVPSMVTAVGPVAPVPSVRSPPMQALQPTPVGVGNRHTERTTNNTTTHLLVPRISAAHHLLLLLPLR